MFKIRANPPASKLIKSSSLTGCLAVFLPTAYCKPDSAHCCMRYAYVSCIQWLRLTPHDDDHLPSLFTVQQCILWKQRSRRNDLRFFGRSTVADVANYAHSLEFAVRSYQAQQCDAPIEQRKDFLQSAPHAVL